MNEYSAPATSEHGPSIGVRDLTTFFRSSFQTIAICAVSLGVVGLAYSMTAAPVFTARAQMILDPGRAQIVFGENRDLAHLSDQTRIESQVEVIKSDAIALAVIRDLDLVTDAEFSKASRSTRWSPLQWFAMESADDDESERHAMGIYDNNLAVRRVGQSLIIEVAFSSNAPEKAAKIANAITEAYIRRDILIQSEAAQNRVKWLSERLNELRQQTYDALRAYERFKLIGDKESSGEPQVKLAELESVSQSYRRVYDVFLQQFTETLQKISYPESDARIVSAATAPLGKSHPKTKLIVAFCMLVGGVGGTLFSWARYALNRPITANRLKQELDLNCLGEVGTYDNHVSTPVLTRLRNLRHLRSMEALRERTPIPVSLRAVERDPLSAFTMDIRRIIYALECILGNRKSGCIGVLAWRSGAGVTTIAANYSLLCSIAGLRTLLVDANHQNPTLSRELATSPRVVGRSLAELVGNPKPSDQTIADLANSFFSVLPFGDPNTSPRPADRIGTRTGAIQISDLKTKFDLVVFDLPAFEESPDALALSPFLDGIVLVVDGVAASLDGLVTTRDALVNAGGTILGVVVNRSHALRLDQSLRRKGSAFAPRKCGDVG
ncbi:MAG: hypothetical protein HC829_00060 [Bacteroidales bacterium]|nr:hypothetical protein [Bacteroidales bacterium]